MGCHSAGSVFLIFACFFKFCAVQYAIPSIKFEAFTPKGLRISIPADKGVELFAFHGKLNKPILQIEPGEFSEDVTRATNGRFTYVNPSIKLKENDVINYWVFVQQEQLGFRKDDQSWTVNRLLPQSDLEKSPGETCGSTITKVLGKTKICSGEDIINYKFSENELDSQLWQIEQFIPDAPDFEYVIFKNEPDVIKLENNVLRIRPKVVTTNSKKEVVVEGCTRQGKPEECQKSFHGIFQPPIISGRMVSKGAFCFAQITVRAKVPKGDWIFPEIYLEDIDDPQRRILLALVRGNVELTLKGTDIGGKMLLGGPYIVFNDVRKKPIITYLATHNNERHTGDEWHTFNARWTNDEIDLYIDETNYGRIDADALRATGFNKESMVRLVLGVGAGGVHNFPDLSISGPYKKPWKSRSRDAIKNFTDHKNEWEPTWGPDSELLVEYVTIKAL